MSRRHKRASRPAVGIVQVKKPSRPPSITGRLPGPVEVELRREPEVQSRRGDQEQRPGSTGPAAITGKTQIDVMAMWTNV